MTVLEFENDQVSDLVGFYMNENSPKLELIHAIKAVAKMADALFERDSEFRMSGFVPFRPGEKWSKVLTDLPPGNQYRRDSINGTQSDS